jgi:hypothetical protein
VGESERGMEAGECWIGGLMLREREAGAMGRGLGARKGGKAGEWELLVFVG